MKFRQFIEADEFDRNSLNQYLRQQGDWRQQRMSGQTRDQFQYGSGQLEQIGKMIEAAKAKVEQIINTNFRQEWPMYKKWEDAAHSGGFLFGHFSPNFEKLGPAIQIGPAFDFSQHDKVTVTQEFYNLLMWRGIVKATISAYENADNINSMTSLAQGVRRLATFLKTPSSTA